MGVDRDLERAVRSEMGRREGRGSRAVQWTSWPRALESGLHRGQHDVLAHLHRVAALVPARFRAVAWLHHAGSVAPVVRGLAATGLSDAEIRALELLADTVSVAEQTGEIERIRPLAHARGTAGRIARVVGRAALTDLLMAGHPVEEHLAMLEAAA
ncbi:MAG TPA: hypothetical protein VKG82_04650 [Solirubrobacteraceae bacterium]|nr:hypothetical protein [Solirubrobacteraceae bacterium]HME03035.1 hypothetical protein [Solirubrobacteraceae bacterium]